jgi:TnsA endonuclease N terminal
MAKRNRSITAKTKAKRKKEGRGQGHGASYKPELRIQDVSSIGLATRDRGWKTNRIHHLLSKLEWMFFYILEWSPVVSDIREQYPLDLDETLAIAKSLGIAHPTDPRTREPVVMTTDFVITIKSRVNTVLHARTIKYTNKLSSRRALEKLEIE